MTRFGFKHSSRPCAFGQDFQQFRRSTFAVILGMTLVISFRSGAGAAESNCIVPTGGNISYLPITTPPKYLMPLPEPGEALPADCPFYQQAWQTFLYVTQPKGGKPAFLGYLTFEKIFKKKATPFFADERPGTLSLAPRSVELPNARVPPDPELDIQDIVQAAAGSAGLQKVLIDQNGNAVWYAIHVNDAFVSLLKDYDLTKPDVLKQIPPDLEFRPGVVELKSAWQIVEGTTPKNYITTTATIPMFKVGADGKITTDASKTRRVTVALLSLHVVTLVEGHPEFIWATFEHVSHQANGWIRDVAPAATDNPDKTPVLVDTKLPKYSLYPMTSTANPAPPVDRANIGNKIGELKLDVGTQKFLPSHPFTAFFQLRSLIPTKKTMKLPA